MVCPQTTHCAILLSLLGEGRASRNTVPRNGDKRRSHPRVLVLIEARRRLLTPRTNMRPKGNKFQRPQARHCPFPKIAEPEPGAGDTGTFVRLACESPL